MSTDQPTTDPHDAPPRVEPWVDLAATLPGAGIVGEGARCRAQGAGTDRSWRVGADGEVAVAELLAELTGTSRWERLRGRRPGWRGAPLGPARRRPRPRTRGPIKDQLRKGVR